MRTACWGVALIALALTSGLSAQDPPARGGQEQGQGAPPRRTSPPQPQQRQGLDYFAGSWAFTWIGRESVITPGPRRGTVTFTRANDPNSLDLRIEGSSEAGGPYKESAVLAWDEARKTLTMREHLAGGAVMTSVGDWSSPIGIQFEGDPVVLNGQTVKLRRGFRILSATSFSVTEELSTDGGPFVRLGTGDFRKF